MDKESFSRKFLIGLAVYIIALTISYTVIFCFKGSYPTEIYLANIPPLIAEFFFLYKLKINKRKYEQSNEEGKG